MKNILSLILVTCFISFSCAAQKKIASFTENEIVKTNMGSYKIKKANKKVTIENTSNRLSNVKQNSPNLPINMKLNPYYIKLDLTQLTKICSKYISLEDIKGLSQTTNAGLFIEIRTDLKGKVLEVSFFTDENSILDLQQLESIENDIKSVKLIAIKPEADKYTKGSNFLLVDAKIYFEDMLKVKRTMQ